MERKNAWLTYTDADKAALEAVSARYTDYLSKGKTERECTTLCAAEAEKRGYINLDKLIAEGITPIRRWGQPEDIGNMVAALASGKFDFAAGQIIDADGGFHIRRL